jgi:hypothetical protein
VEGNEVVINLHQPEPVKFEQSFEGHFPVEKRLIRKTLTDEFTFDFEGIGFVLRGRAGEWASTSGYVGKVEVYVDGKLMESVELPANFTTRRYELFWKYQLPNQKHTVRIKLLNPAPENPIHLEDVIIYSTDHTGS